MPLTCFSANVSGGLSLSARSAILIEGEEREVLYEKNGRERLPMASTTKIMTALVAAELLELDALISIPREAVGVEGSSIYLCEGEVLTVEQLLYALLLESANDAATALAVCAAGSVEDFAKKCNEKAKELNLKDTNFTNPHGLYDEEHYTTAYDLAQIAAHALKDPKIRKITATKRATIPLRATQSNLIGEGVRYLKNHNKMLSLYEGAIGVKTGFTKKSGRCLVSAAERDGLTLIAVTLNAPDDWRDHAAMLDLGFDNYESKTIYEAGEFCYDFPLSNGASEYARAVNLSPIRTVVPKGKTEYTQSVESHFRFAIAPVAEGQILGRVTVVINGKTLSSTLICAESIDAKYKKRSFFD